MGINTYVKAKSKTFLIIFAVVFTTFIGYVDYLTGFELRIDVFYLMPISFVTWYIGKKTGIYFSLMSIVLIFSSDLLSNPDHHIHGIDIWNLSMILLFFIIVTLALSQLRTSADEQRKLLSELQKAFDDIKTTNESLEAFSYSVSHDLRSPLWRIEGFTEILAEKYSHALDEKGKEYIGRILSSTQRMKDLIDALLKLALYSRGNINRSSVDLTALVRRTMEESAKSWPGRTVEMVTAAGVIADGDPALLQVVIFNLVENALKFTKHRSVAKIEFGLTKADGKDVYFIRDNGAGFSMTNAKRLFNPFERFHSESDFSGFGIGLATVQRIIHCHGGRIWAESGVDKGATFYFTLD